MSDTRKNLIDKIDRALDRLTLRSIFFRRKTFYSPQGFAYATFHRRLIAASIDAFILMLVLIPFNDLIISTVYKDVRLDEALVRQAVEQSKTQAELNLAMFKLQMDAGFGVAFAYQLEIQFCILAVYSFIFWHLYAGTPGKLLLGMRIVDAKNGARISDMQSVFRLAGYLFSGFFLMLGFIVISVSRKKRGWHDIFAGTSVIVERDKLKPTPAQQPADQTGSPESKAKE